MSTPDPLLMMVATLQGQVAALEARVRKLEEERREAPPPAAALAPSPPAAPLEAHRARERQEIIAALDKTSWNRLEVARMLGIPRRTLYRRMAEYGIQEGDTRPGIAKKERELAGAKKKAR